MGGVNDRWFKRVLMSLFALSTPPHGFAHISRSTHVFAWLVLTIFSPDQRIYRYPERGTHCYRRIIILRKYYKQGDLIGICHI